VVIDAFVVMPNHVHGILDLTQRSAGSGQGGRMPALGSIVGSFKSAVSSRVNTLRNTPGTTIWQRGFHDRVIRTDEELFKVRKYIAENPLAWHLDRENPNTWR
jgi:REP element-mobilizing transposase RayT